MIGASHLEDGISKPKASSVKGEEPATGVNLRLGDGLRVLGWETSPPPASNEKKEKPGNT